MATRFVVPEAGVPATILLRFAGASVLMLAFTLPRTPIRVARGDAPVIVALGLVQFAVFPWLFTTSLSHIPAARAAMVLSTQPLFTLAFSAAVGRERLSVLKVIGGVIALVAVAFALGDRVAAADADTWKGDLYMFGAVLSGSIYNVASGYALRRYRALVVASVMIPTGAVAIAALVLWRGDWAAFANISAAGWFAVLYLTSFGGAITFFLWIWALEHTSPSRVALAVTLNPVSAAVLGAFVLAEPVGERLLVGVAGVVGALVLVNWSAIVKSVGRGPRL